MSLLRQAGSLLDRFLSDRRWLLKVLVLGLVYVSLAFYFREANPQKGAQWQRVVFRAAAAREYQGRQVSLTHTIVGRVLEDGRGAVLEVGWPRLEVTALGLAGVEPGDRVDLNGTFVDGTTMDVSEVRIHQGSHSLKVWVSLAAALAALAIFFRAFQLNFKGGSLILPRE